MTARILKLNRNMRALGSRNRGNKANRDPYGNNVILLLHMEGSNNSTTFADSSFFPKTVTANGDAKISTAQSKWGNGSGYFDGSGDFLATSSWSLSIGSNDFSAEAWIYISGNSALDGNNERHAYGFRETTDSVQLLIVTGNASITGTGLGIWNGSQWDSCTYTFSKNTWYHIAQTRQSGVLRYFVNGGKIREINWNYSLGFSNKVVHIGGTNIGSGYNRYFNGYIQDLRITINVARYIADFTPPYSLLSNPKY